MNFFEHFLVFRCIGCDEALPTGQILCAQCVKEFRAECSSPCKYCHGKHIECGCFGSGRKIPADRVLHLAPYRGKGVTHNMISQCKSTRDKYLMSFMAQLMMTEIERKLSPGASAVLVPMPRSRAAYLKNGFDQSKLIGKGIADALDIDYAEAIMHTGKKRQKLLGYRDRLRNAKDAFVLDESAAELIRGKRVILYDDIITTGASAAACVKLMRDAGAAGVDFVSFARTEK